MATKLISMKKYIEFNRGKNMWFDEYNFWDENDKKDWRNLWPIDKIRNDLDGYLSAMRQQFLIQLAKQWWNFDHLQSFLCTMPNFNSMDIDELTNFMLKINEMKNKEYFQWRNLCSNKSDLEWCLKMIEEALVEVKKAICHYIAKNAIDFISNPKTWEKELFHESYRSTPYNLALAVISIADTKTTKSKLFANDPTQNVRIEFREYDENQSKIEKAQLFIQKNNGYDGVQAWSRKE